MVGGEIGLDLGTAALTAMGLGFLIAAIGKGIGEMTFSLKTAIDLAWHAGEPDAGFRQNDLDRAARELAHCTGIFFRLILQGILAYILKRGTFSSGKAAIATGRSVVTNGAKATADGSVTEVAALLRKSKLPDEFASWVEKNWEDLRRNPKLNGDRSEVSPNGERLSSQDKAKKSTNRSENGKADSGSASNTSRPPGLHNQEWQDIKVEKDSFKTISKTDLNNLSESESLAARTLEGQGWKPDKINEILKSGENLTTKELGPGDKLYGFNTAGRGKDINTSAYWLDEAGFQNVKGKYFKDGAWDREGLKSYLALPCYNKANAIDLAEITNPTTVVEAKIAKATELIQYTTEDGYSTGLLGKIMGGGGSQVTVNPSLIKSIPGM